MSFCLFIEGEKRYKYIKSVFLKGRVGKKDKDSKTRTEDTAIVDKR